MNFHVGQQVVFVLDVSSPWLVKGRVYTVREVCPDTKFNAGGNIIEVLGLKLEELIRDQRGYPDYPFGAFGFRPVAKTDISIFTAMLAPTPQKERVEP